MINQQKLQEVLRAYKAQFATHFAKEKFKWEAVQHFQTHWDIEAPDFAGMFEQATKKAQNLLISANYFPRGVIIDFARKDAHAVRAMFRALFDERTDVIQRVTQFIATATTLQQQYFEPQKQSFQNINSVSTYLWLMYPDKYYIYKHSEYVIVANVLESPFKPKRGDYERNLAGGFQLYDAITSVLARDSELRTMLAQACTPTCYPDPQLRTLAVDVGYFMSTRVNEISTPVDVVTPDTPVVLPAAPVVTPIPFQFAIEKHLEDFIIRNWQHTIFGRDYNFYNDGDTDGQQYPTDTGPIDILAVSKDNKTLLVIELKKDRSSDATVGQILRYMSYIKETLAQPGQHVHGAIVSFAEDKSMRRAISMVPSVKYYRYQMHFDLVEQF